MGYIEIMYSKTTRGITVTVKPYFLDDQSSPQENHYVWAYQVNIKNSSDSTMTVSYTHLRAHETPEHLVCRLLLEKKKKKKKNNKKNILNM